VNNYPSIHKHLNLILSLFVCQLIEEYFDLLLSHLSESGVLLCGYSDLYFVSFEVAWDDRLENWNSSLNCLLGAPLTLILLPVLLQLAGCFLLLSTCSHCLETNWLAWRVYSVCLRSELFIDSHNSDVDTEWSHAHILGILLEIHAQWWSKDVHWHLIPVLELELGRALSQPLDDELSVVHVSHSNASSCVADIEDVCYWGRNNQLIRYFLLGADHYCIETLDCDGCSAKHLNSLESVFHLVDPSVWGEDLHQLFHTHICFLLSKF